ncbi:unnamed protein product [Anisakis simplex]|uniref:IF rod domain-containing protein n=1 Tax=Anisakis simplex TaxID=6269 RepID=A0A3P6QHQ3_ANISI|nr:unnamed protein product [Anisakis simplex]
MSRLDYQNRLQMLIEEIDFTKHEHEQEVMDLQAAAVHDTTPENREYFRNELAGAIREIRAKYDQVMVGYRSDIDSWYELKVRELYTSSNRQNIERGYTKQEVTRLRKQMGDLRGRLADFEARVSWLWRFL